MKDWKLRDFARTHWTSISIRKLLYLLYLSLFPSHFFFYFFVIFFRNQDNSTSTIHLKVKRGQFSLHLKMCNRIGKKERTAVDWTKNKKIKPRSGNLSLWQHVNVKESKFNRSARASCIYGVRAAETRFRRCCLSGDFERRMDLCDIILYTTLPLLYIRFSSNWIKGTDGKWGARFQFLLIFWFKGKTKIKKERKKEKKNKSSASESAEHWEDKSAIAERDGLLYVEQRVPITNRSIRETDMRELESR